MDDTSKERPKFAYTIADPPLGPTANGAKLKVMGVGGGGGNVVNYMAQNNLGGVELIAANTDIQDLDNIPDTVAKIQIGAMHTRGLGAGMDPGVGSAAAQESVGEIEDCLSGADMVFLISCMGGGTGTGASPIIAEIAREMSILTVGVVTLPFATEQEARMRVALGGTRDLHGCVDALITIPNDKLTSVFGGEVLFWEAFDHINEYLAGVVRGIADIVNKQGVINLDFADVKSVLSSNGRGVTVIGTGLADGLNRAEEATMAALRSPLLDDVDLSGARNALFNIRTARLTLDEYNKVSGIFSRLMQSGGRVWPGVVADPELEDEIEVTVLVSGIEDSLDKPIDERIRQFPTKSSKANEEVTVPIEEPIGQQDQATSQEVGEEETATSQLKDRARDRVLGRRISTSDIPSLFRNQAD